MPRQVRPRLLRGVVRSPARPLLNREAEPRDNDVDTGTARHHADIAGRHVLTEHHGTAPVAAVPPPAHQVLVTGDAKDIEPVWSAGDRADGARRQVASELFGTRERATVGHAFQG